MLKRISQSVLTKKLFSQRLQNCSSNISPQNTKSAEQFNTYKNINQIVKNEQLHPEKETRWNRQNDKELMQERKKIRDKRKENMVAVGIAFSYFIFENQFEMDGLKISTPQFSFFKNKSEDMNENQITPVAVATQ